MLFLSTMRQGRESETVGPKGNFLMLKGAVSRQSRPIWLVFPNHSFVTNKCVSRALYLNSSVNWIRLRRFERLGKTDKTSKANLIQTNLMWIKFDVWTRPWSSSICPSVPSFVFAVSFKSFVNVLTLSLPQSVMEALTKGGSNFWLCERNPIVWLFKWNLVSSTFTWYYLYFSILQNEIWDWLSGYFYVALFGR